MRENNSGLDLSENYEKVRHVAQAEYGEAPVETEDLVQRVCQKILKRNNSSSPYNPDKSSVARYVHVVARSVLSTTMRKKSFENERTFDPHESDPSDPVEPEFSFDLEPIDPKSFRDFLRSELSWDDTKPRRVYLLMRMGFKRSEIADILDESPRSISWYRTRLKRLLDEYADRNSDLEAVR